MHRILVCLTLPTALLTGCTAVSASSSISTPESAPAAATAAPATPGVPYPSASGDAAAWKVPDFTACVDVAKVASETGTFVEQITQPSPTSCSYPGPGQRLTYSAVAQIPASAATGQDHGVLAGYGTGAVWQSMQDSCAVFVPITSSGFLEVLAQFTTSAPPSELCQDVDELLHLVSSQT